MPIVDVLEISLKGVLTDMDLLMESCWTGAANFGTTNPSLVSTVFDLPPQLVGEFSDSFKVYDRNGDGKISREELGVVMRSLGQDVSDTDLELLIKEVDASGDGHIDLYEFIDLNTRPIEISQPTKTSTSDRLGKEDCGASNTALLSAAFTVFDADNSGFISAQDLQRAMVRFGDATASMEECQRMIQSVDRDGDRLVSFAEFETLMSGICID